MSRHDEIIHARSEAARVRVDLGIDPDQPVDVFAAIRRAGLWIVFVETEHLLGAMSREGVGGIMINPARPLGMQRYTAAHELGHWHLHHDNVVWDTDAEMMGSNMAREVGAQEFAAAFLMPRRLVNHTLRQLGVERGDPIDAVTAYGLGRNLGVSYEAALRQLENFKAITFAERTELGRATPASIKKQLAGGRVIDRNASVWKPAINQLDRLDVILGDEIVVSLPENRTTGFQWDVTDPNASLSLVHDDFAIDETEYVGSPGRRELVFRAEAEGFWQQQLLLQRKTRIPTPPAEAWSLNVTVRLTPALENIKIVSDPNDRGY